MGFKSIEGLLENLVYHHAILTIAYKKFDEFKTYENLNSSDLEEIKSQLLIHNSEYQIDSSSPLALVKSFISSFKQVEKANRLSAFTRPTGAWKYFVTKNFTKNGGPLGNILVLRQEEILIFAKLISASFSESKIHINTFWAELLKRGVSLDLESKNTVLKYLDSVGLLESLSDAGDAKYVRKTL